MQKFTLVLFATLGVAAAQDMHFFEIHQTMAAQEGFSSQITRKSPAFQLSCYTPPINNSRISYCRAACVSPCNVACLCGGTGKSAGPGCLGQEPFLAKKCAFLKREIISGHKARSVSEREL